MTPRAASALDAVAVGERIEEADQQLAVAEPRDLVLGRLAHLERRASASHGVAERRAGLGVRGVGERGGRAGAGLDDDLEAGRGQLAGGLGNERDPRSPGVVSRVTPTFIAPNSMRSRRRVRNFADRAPYTGRA